MEVDLETGNRNPKSALVRNILIYVALAWSVFQLYVSSPLVLEITPWMNADVVKRVHVSFAGFLAFLTYPAFKRSRSEERRVGKECRSRWSPYH